MKSWRLSAVHVSYSERYLQFPLFRPQIITSGNVFRRYFRAFSKVVELIDVSQISNDLKLVRNSDLGCEKAFDIGVSKACGNYIEGSLLRYLV